MARLFSDPKQIGIIVRDIEKAMNHWINNLGIGPWFYTDRVPVDTYRYKGKVVEGYHVSTAISHSGAMQMELIQPRHTFASGWTDFLIQGHEGMHHFCTFESDYDAVCKRAVERGLELVHEGEMSRGRFAYFLHPATPNTYIEVAEAHPDRLKMFENIKSAALNWDGSDPIRYKPPI